MRARAAPNAGPMNGKMVIIKAGLVLQSCVWASPQMHHYRATALENMLREAKPPVPRGAPPTPFDRTGDTRQDGRALPAEVVVTPRPEDYLPDDALPAKWDWRNVAEEGGRGVSYTTRVRNQFLPLWCGSCWAHAATAVLGARWLIHSNGTSPGADFSVQYFVNCVNGSHGCHGGSTYEAFGFAHQVGAVDSSCIPYVAYNQNCTAVHTCDQNLNGFHPKVVTADPIRYFVSEYGVVGRRGDNRAAMEAAMMKEIYVRGPVASCMACPEEFEQYTGGVFATTNNRAESLPRSLPLCCCTHTPTPS